MDDEHIIEIVNRHVDGIVTDMQAALSVTTGDVAGQFFTGDNDLDEIKAKLVQTMNAYARTEGLYKD
jgi:hypothetical protein